MWKTRFTLTACAAVLVISAGVFNRTQAQGPDPTTWPLVESSHIEYLGAFRLPSDTVNGHNFSFSFGLLAFNPANQSLYVSSWQKRVAEVSIPTPAISATIAGLPVASFIAGQEFQDPSENHWTDISTEETNVGGMLKYNNKLVVSGWIYYDAANTQRVSHFTRSPNLTTASFSGFSAVWQADKSGFVSGYMSPLPTPWHSLLGGPSLTGNCCIPIISRTSFGPSAFAFDPSQVGVNSLVTAQPLVYYDEAHPTLGPWSGSNATFGSTTNVTGLTVIDGTRTALFFGKNGTGPHCYGKGTSNPDLHNQIDPADGEKWCYDPTNSNKGPHAYPYNFQLWAYDMNEFAAVKAGSKLPWNVVPYGVWPITLPFNTSTSSIMSGGAAYDPVTRRLFVVQRDKDFIGCCYYGPLVHVYQINTAAPANPVTNVTITSNLASPQPPNTAITFTATATGGNAPVQYKFFTYDGCTWTFGNWTTSNQFVWTPTTHNANARVGVWAKSATNSSDVAEANTSMAFAVAGGSGSVSSVSLASSHASPQPAGTTIVWTATPSGGSGALSYKWLIYDGTAWTPVSSWSSSNMFTWRPAVPNGAYKVSVWVKHSTNGADAAEASAASSSFIITGS